MNDANSMGLTILVYLTFLHRLEWIRPVEDKTLLFTVQERVFVLHTDKLGPPISINNLIHTCQHRIDIASI